MDMYGPYYYALPVPPSLSYPSVEHTEIIHDYATDNSIQCRACLSVGRRLTPLLEFANIYMKLTTDYLNCDVSSVLICWQCRALLKKVAIFQEQVKKASELLQDQAYIYGSLSNLISVTLSDRHETIFFFKENTNVTEKTDESINKDTNLKEEDTNLKAKDTNINERDNDMNVEDLNTDVGDTNIDVEVPNITEADSSSTKKVETASKKVINTLDVNDAAEVSDILKSTVKEVDFYKLKKTIANEDVESIKKHKKITEADALPDKSKSRWAAEKALLSKLPKFTEITQHNKSFKKMKMSLEILYTCMQRERMSDYYKATKFRCDDCVITFPSNEKLDAHYRRWHSPIEEFTCDICNNKVSDKRHLLIHKSRHHVYKCRVCQFICRRQIKAWHFEKEHVKKVFQCNTCKLQFQNKRSFWKHFREWHERFACHHCGVQFKMRYCIVDHLRFHRAAVEGDIASTRPRPYVTLVPSSEVPCCPECGADPARMFPRRNRQWRLFIPIIVYLLIRKQHSPFTCAPCNKSFSRYNGLWLHNKLVHRPASPASCARCGALCRDSYRLRWHLCSHKPRAKPRIPCKACDKIFSKKIYMTDHYNLVHLKLFKYRCEACDKNFVRNADLLKHRRKIHDGILPPKNKICYICGKGFTTNKILTNHVRTHELKTV